MLISNRQLRAFVSVVTYGNFTKAADRMHMTQAGLSGMIRELEAQLRCRLFHRTTRSVELTKAGAHLLPYVRRALQDLDEGIESIGCVNELRRGRLRIGVTPFLSAHVMPDVIKTLSDRRPALRVELVDADQHVIQRLVDGGELDAAFGYLFTRTAGVHKQPLFSDPLTMVVPRDQYLQCQRVHCPEEWEAMREATLIVLHKSNPLMPVINDFLASAEAPDFRRMEIRHLATVLNMVAAGVGIAVIPASTLLAEQSHRVRIVPLGVDPPAIEHCCLTKAGAGEVDGLGEFAELFSLTFQESMARARKALVAD